MAAVKMKTIETPRAAENPSAELVRRASAEISITDPRGRVITLKKPGVLAQFELIKVLAEHAKNSVYVNMVLPLIYVTAIDGEPVFQPTSQLQINGLITRLDEDGIEAIGLAVLKNFSLPDPKAAKEELKK